MNCWANVPELKEKFEKLLVLYSDTKEKSQQARRRFIHKWDVPDFRIISGVKEIWKKYNKVIIMDNNKWKSHEDFIFEWGLEY